MRFKALFSAKGLQTLDKEFLPTLEKFGKNCEVLLGPEEVVFVQRAGETDGAHVSVRFTAGVLFEESTYKLQSKHYNLIAFSLDVALLLRVIRGAGANHAETVELKLTQRLVPSWQSQEPQTQPFLSFHGQGHSLSFTQDLPITRPYGKEDVDVLVQNIDVPQLCPFYVNLRPAVLRLQSLVDKMKNLSGVLQLSTTRAGEIHVQVSSAGVMFGSQVRGLSVFPQGQMLFRDAEQEQQQRLLGAQAQLQSALDNGEAASVSLQLKHFLRVLGVCTLSRPEQVLCGIAEGNAHVHVVFVFKDPNSDVAYDDKVGLSFKLPVREE